MLAADFIDLAALNYKILIIEVVELDLYDLDRRILSQDLVEDLSFVMERQPHMADQTFFFESKSSFICTAFFKEFKVTRILCMHKVKIEVFDPACFELASEKRSDIFF